MNLAKIRQKARQGLTKALVAQEPLPEQCVSSGVVLPGDDPVFSPTIIHDCSPNTDVPAIAIPVPECQKIPLRRNKEADPIEIILSGRAAAGCDEDLIPASEEMADQITDDYAEILCFRVSDEVYGINIMEIKEIIKPREVTEVPRAPSFIQGVISLRGVIIPVLDMRNRLGLAQESQSSRERIVVVKHHKGFTGLLVDEVIQVVRIGKDWIEPAPTVLEGIDRDFVNGIGRSGDMMVILLNVTHITDIDLC